MPCSDGRSQSDDDALIHQRTDMLCRILRRVEAETPWVIREYPDVAAWWIEHKAWDDERVKRGHYKKVRYADSNPMKYNTILIEYKPYQVDIHTWVTIKDSNGVETESHFELDGEANSFVDNQPSDYYVIDRRPDNNRKYYVRDFHKDRYNLDPIQ